MAASPRWKVYDPQGNYAASCVWLEDAACLIALHGDGATIRDGHRKVLWTEGKEEIPAWESYDSAAETCLSRAGAVRGA